MMREMIMTLALAGAVVMAPAAFAEEQSQPSDVQAPAAPHTITTQDGVLSIQLPADEWKLAEDSNHWLVLTDGNDVITIDHLSNGENLPALQVAGTDYSAVYQAAVSTRNEVFFISGYAVKQEDLPAIMQAIGTIQILKFDTKTALQKQTEKAPEIGIRAINEVYYVAADDLHVRSGCSMEDTILGLLNRGETVKVIGAVTEDGKDNGWYQIEYHQGQAYVSAGFLAKNPPSSPSASSTPAPAPAPAQSSSASSGGAAQNQEMAYCEYCGNWYPAGNIFRNHVCPNRDAALNPDEEGRGDIVEDPASEGLAYCEYCGGWYEAGNVFRNHVCPNRDAALGIDDDDEDY